LIRRAVGAPVTELALGVSNRCILIKCMSQHYASSGTLPKEKNLPPLSGTTDNLWARKVRKNPVLAFRGTPTSCPRALAKKKTAANSPFEADL